MRLLFVVQRYGAGIAGGAEQHCRAFATRLAARGHQVEVVTSCAIEYLDWANRFEPGTSVEGGVTLHRLEVRAPRRLEVFQPLDFRVVGRRPKAPYFLQREWLRLQGPEMAGLAEWLEDNAGRFDLAIFFTYLYEPAYLGLAVAARHCATLLHPTAHDEPTIYLPLFRYLWHLPDGFAFSTEEERDLLERFAPLRRPTAVVGIGVEAPVGSDIAAFRSRYRLGERPYLLYLGRLDSHKGSEELHDFFVAYKRRHEHSDLVLAMVGSAVESAGAGPAVVMTGFVGDDERDAALAGAFALAVPSYFESFSMVLAEAWAAGVPALVQGRTEVLVGQARRSGAGLPYRGYAEFEAALELLESNPSVAATLGARGRAYVDQRYQWDGLLERYERFCRRVLLRSGRRSPSGPRATTPIAAQGVAGSGYRSQHSRTR